VVHAIQNARKAAGLNVEDRIALTLGGDDELLDAVRANEDYVTAETLTTTLSYDGAGGGEETAIEGRSLTIAVSRSG
jgi:isoleucyl-tRNA synthetase